MITQFNRGVSWICDSLYRQFNEKIFPHPECSYEMESSIYHQVNVKYDYFIEEGKKIPYAQLSTAKSRQSKKCAIYFHGNGEDIGHVKYIISLLVQKANLTIYALEYPTYGLYKKSLRCRISNAIKQDSLRFYDFLIREGRTYKDIAVIGRSIGSGPASYLGGHKLLSALILISPFSTLKDWTKKYGFWGRIIKQHFNNEQEVKKFSGKFMVIHGQKDNLIDISHSKKLVKIYQTHNSLKEDARTVYPLLMSHNNFDLQDDIVDPIIQFLEDIKFLQINFFEK